MERDAHSASQGWLAERQQGGGLHAPALLSTSAMRNNLRDELLLLLSILVVMVASGVGAYLYTRSLY